MSTVDVKVLPGDEALCQGHVVFWACVPLVHGDEGRVSQDTATSPQALTWHTAVSRQYDTAMSRHHNTGMSRHHDNRLSRQYDTVMSRHHDTAMSHKHDTGMSRHHDTGLS